MEGYLIKKVAARQVFDSRANPTVEVDVILEDGTLDPKCHAGYREAMIEVAKQNEIPYVDFTSLTKEKIENTTM